MKKIFLLTISVLSLLLTGCKDDIDFDYHHVDSQLVVEGEVTNLGSQVRITLSQDMEDTGKPQGVSDAQVSILGDDGSMAQLKYTDNGLYVDSSFIGKKGVTYRLIVNKDNKTYTSYSVMPDTVTLRNVYFDWQKVMKERILCLHMQFSDIKDDKSYYQMRIYRNDSLYKWNLLVDYGYENRTIEREITMISERNLDKDDEDNRDRMVYEGDRIRLELYAVDKHAFDYLYALLNIDDLRSNPDPNITGGCLGYFSARTIDRKEIIYHRPE